MGRLKLFFKEHSEWPHALVVLCCFGFCGLVCCFIGIFIHYHTQLEIENWPSVTGTIISSRVIEHTDEYCLEYSYEYEADGQKFENNTFLNSLDETKCYSLKEEAIENKPEKETKVSVFYNPKDPSESYIHHVINISADSLVFIIIGVFAIVVGTFLSCVILFELVNMQPS